MKYSSQDLRLLPQKSPSRSGKEVKEWPADARTLTRSLSILFFNIAADLLVCGFWICVLIYGVTISWYSGHRLNDIPFDVKQLIEAGRYASTLFPILFAATVGRCLKNISLWRLRRGERIGTLDQLLGSTSVVNTFITQFYLRSLGGLGAALVILWSLSPLGSQASLRAPSIGKLSSSSNVTLPYLSMQNAHLFTGRGSDRVALRVPATAVFISSLISSPAIKESPRDNWGNLKIPFLDSSTGSVDDRRSEWSDVDWDDHITSTRSSSLLGVPVGNIPVEGNTSFNLQTSYFDLDCPVLTSCPNLEVPQCKEIITSHVTNRTINADGRILRVYYDGFTESRSNGSDLDMPPKKFLFLFQEFDGLALGICDIRTVFVEMQVSCVGIDCSVTHIRNSSINHLPMAWTYLDSLPDTLSEFMGGFVNAIDGRPSRASALTTFFTNPGHPFSVNTSAESLTKTITPASFSRSLSQLLNTFWIAGIGDRVLPQGRNANLSAFSDTRFEGTNATIYSEDDILICNKDWLTALLIATLAPFLAGILNVVLDLMPSSLGPTLSMNISTMIRDNPYVAIPQGGSTLDDSERSRLLRDVKVRLGDVAPAAETGHIAVGSLSGDKEVVVRLQHRRLYD